MIRVSPLSRQAIPEVKTLQQPDNSAENVCFILEGQSVTKCQHVLLTLLGV